MVKKIFERGDLDRRLSNLPKEVKYCKKCVISNQRPRIVFDEEGVCSACRYIHYKENIIDWENREKQLQELLDKHRRNDGYWDVVVPSSGGKDSGLVAHQLKHKYGMHPLTATWVPLIYTDIGYQNFQNFREAGFTNLLCSPNGRLHRKLARLSFEELGDAFHAFVLGQVNYPVYVAIKFGIKLIFYGENGLVEYVGDMASDKPYLPVEEWGRTHSKGSTLQELIDYGLKHKDYLSEEDIDESELVFYKPPTLEELKKAGIEGKYFYSYYHKWDPHENYEYAVKHTGYQSNPERTEGTYTRYASLDDRLDGMHYYMRYIKLGLGRAIEDAAHEIRDGRLTREEGVELVRRYDHEFPSKYFKDFLEYLDITEEHCWNVIDSYRLPHLWEKVNGEWRFKHPIS